MFALTASILCAAAMATAITKEMMIAAVSRGAQVGAKDATLSSDGPPP
jgi:hypothetical protein